MMKVDLCMWAKNGEKYLHNVLGRLEAVIPQENISQRIFVDDKSRDRSREIAKEFGWDVYQNPTGWVSGGTTEALRHVKEEFFVSVEQDVLLAKDWWDRIPPYMEDDSVAVAQGIRYSTNPTLRILEEEWIGKKTKMIPRGRTPQVFWSLDNTIFRTKVVREVGFPTFEPLAVDYFFKLRLEEQTDYKWILDTDVISDHIREGILSHYKHSQVHLKYTTFRQGFEKFSLLKMFEVLGLSPYKGLRFAAKWRYPKLFFQYPLIQLLYFQGYVLRRQSLKSLVTLSD